MNNSLAEVHPELVSEWSEKNLTLTPDDITFGSNKKVWWSYCTRSYVREIILRYCQNRTFFRTKFNIKDGNLF